MTNENKERLIYGIKQIGLVLVAVLTIIVCAGNWNANAEPFAKVASIVLLFCVGIFIWRTAKRNKEEYDKKSKELTE